MRGIVSRRRGSKWYITLVSQDSFQPRRSDRILLHIPLQVAGSDSSGRPFQVSGSTVFLTSTGASITLPRLLAPGQKLRLAMTNGAETEVTVVGQLGVGPAGGSYGVAFVQPRPDFWGIQFPTSPSSDCLGKTLLECERCRTRTVAELQLIELEVLAANDRLQRHCRTCGVVAWWIIPTVEAAQNRLERSERATSPTPTVAPLKPAPSPAEKRQHRRIGVSKIIACIPPPDGFGPDNVVQVLDMSKGGIRFRSERRYVVGQFVQVAVPYTPGAANIFVQGRIAWGAASRSGSHEYGLKYIRSAP
ncbi:MAG TPA: PilZ domain-containing protein [Terriglobales bacterium]